MAEDAGDHPPADGVVECRAVDLVFDEELIVPNKDLSIAEGAIQAWRKGGRRLIIYYRHLLRSVAKHYGLSAEKPFRITVDITNTGKMAGKEVVQLYICDVASSLERPIKELKGFQKVALKEGETKTVAFDIKIEDLSFYYHQKKKWVAESGEFEVMVGSSSRDIRQHARFTLID